MRRALGIACVAWASSLAAQGSVPFYARPGGPRLAEVAPVAVRLGAVQGAGREAVLEAWAPAAGLRRTGRAAYPWQVGPGGVTLAARPGGVSIGRAEAGMVAEEAERRGSWIRLRRRGWVPGTTPRSAPSATRAPAPASGPPSAAASAPATNVRGLPLRSRPGGRDTVALVLRHSGPLRAVERRGAWVRVQVDGWLPAAAAPALTEPAAVPTTASPRPRDVRARPDAYQGARVRWRVEVLGLERADSLRPDFRPGEAFLLARRPEGEPGLVYLALPEALVPVAQRFAPLQRIVVLGRLRTARARPTGHPLVAVDTLIY